MEEELSAHGPLTDARWRPYAWSLRTKITAVLLLPVIVALILGAGRINTELSQASGLSAVHDQLPILLSTATLSTQVDNEMIAAGTAPGSQGLSKQIAVVNEAAAAVQQNANFAQLDASTERDLSTALGQLGGLRTASASADGDVVSLANGYHDIVFFSLSQMIPGVVDPADNPALSTEADAAQALMQIQTDLAVQNTLVRAYVANPGDESTLVAAGRAETEEQLIIGQVQRIIPASMSSDFTDAVSTAPARADLLSNALTINRNDDLPTLYASIDQESNALNALVSDIVTDLTNNVTTLTDQSRSDALRDTALVLGALLGALAIALYMARTLIYPMKRLHFAALDAANRKLPQTIERVRSGEEIDWHSVEAVPVQTEEEIGQLARAFDEMHRQAVRLAGEQAELRKQVSEMFMTLSRRSQSLVEMQLGVIEDLESDEQDPKRLDGLFRIDHIATRLRRNGENLQVLAGGSPVRQDHGPITMVEVLRAATSEVKDYRRISLGNAPSGSVRAQAAADVVHILAELLENATRFSSPEEKVVLTADRGADGGLLIEVVDTGLGMAEEDLDTANSRLAAGDAVSPETTRRMGLFVVGRLAAPLGITVRLRRTLARKTRSGITASVHVPGELVVANGIPTNLPSALSAPALRLPDPLPAMSGLVPYAVNGAHALNSGTNGLNLLGTSNGANGLNGLNGFVGTTPSAPGTDGIGWPMQEVPEPDYSSTPLPIRPARPALPSGRPTAPVPPPMPTPIFDQMVSGWFVETPGVESSRISIGTGQEAATVVDSAAHEEPDAPSENWVTPVDDAWRAARHAVEQDASPAKITSAGLPVRSPGSQLAPGAAVPRQQAAPQPTDFRDPAAVRNNLARHYSGMRAARNRTKSDSEPAKDKKADPR
jgi:signal transduction histidine kinase